MALPGAKPKSRLSELHYAPIATSYPHCMRNGIAPVSTREAALGVAAAGDQPLPELSLSPSLAPPPPPGVRRVLKLEQIDRWYASVIKELGLQNGTAPILSSFS